MNVVRLLRFVFATAFLGCLADSCIFGSSMPAGPLTMQYVGIQGDTLSPLAVLRFAFSDSVASPLDFDFSPPVGQSYQITLNSACDTATISFVDLLPGDTRYVVRPKLPLMSRSGSTLDADNDTAVFHTAAAEDEPNNTVATADTLRPLPLYGMLRDASDTDVYCVPEKERALYMETFTGQTSLSVKDSAMQDIPVAVGLGLSDTFDFPDHTRFPVYVAVFSPIKGTAGYYKLGVLP